MAYCELLVTHVIIITFAGYLYAVGLYLLRVRNILIIIYLQFIQVNKKSAPVKFDSVFPASLSLGDGHFDIIDTSYANVFLDKRYTRKSL